MDGPGLHVTSSEDAVKGGAKDVDGRRDVEDRLPFFDSVLTQITRDSLYTLIFIVKTLNVSGLTCYFGIQNIRILYAHPMSDFNG